MYSRVTIGAAPAATVFAATLLGADSAGAAAAATVAFVAMTAVIVASVGYLIVQIRRGHGRRRQGRRRIVAAPDHRFVFLIPCLNEGMVIGRTIDHLLRIPGDDYLVMVIDDGSDDDTASIVASHPSPKVLLHRRTGAASRQGKGEALNDAYRELRSRFAGRNLHRVIVCVVDADGRLDPEVLHAVAPHFADPQVAGVQIQVRMHNRADGLLERMQDVEFVVCGDLLQRGRSSIGTAGMGGNGQFIRLGVLDLLKPAPWSHCLTEDLEMGLQLAARGWSLRFEPAASVTQQGLGSPRRLLRQRTRWFQGHLECLRLLPRLWRSPLSRSARFDLCHAVANAVVLLAFQTLSLAWLAVMAWRLAQDPSGFWSRYLAGGRIVWLVVATLALLPVVMWSYARHEPKLSTVRLLGVSLAYLLYSYLWVPAGWMGVVRALRRRGEWAKTERSLGTGDEVAVVAATTRR